MPKTPNPDKRAERTLKPMKTIRPAVFNEHDELVEVVVNERQTIGTLPTGWKARTVIVTWFVKKQLTRKPKEK